jgi:peptidase E
VVTLTTYVGCWILKETGADEIIKDLAQHGKVYGGGSAGAIMAGLTLKFFEVTDDPKVAPEYMTDRLGLTRTVVVPHWQNEKYGVTMEDIANNLTEAGYTIAKITDEQALVVNGDNERIAG